MKHAELREEVTRVSRRMSDSGLVRTTSGNVSARTPEGNVLITPSGLPTRTWSPRTSPSSTLAGTCWRGRWSPRPRFPCTPASTAGGRASALACLGLEIPGVHYMLAALSKEGRVLLAPYATYGTGELAGHASEALGGGHSACLLQNRHGTVAVAETATKAYSLTEILEEMAELYYRTRLAGDPMVLGPGQLAQTRAKISGYGQSKQTPGGTG